MKINPEALAAADGKMLFLIQEEWQGLSPATSYQDQASAVGRALDSVEYIERAIERGDAVLAHKTESRTGTIQLVSTDTLDGLNDYLKGNEAHARLPPMNRTVLPLADWDKGVVTLQKMLARADVRARYETEGTPQPGQDVLDSEAQALLAQRFPG